MSEKIKASTDIVQKLQDSNRSYEQAPANSAKAMPNSIMINDNCKKQLPNKIDIINMLQNSNASHNQKKSK